MRAIMPDLLGMRCHIFRHVESDLCARDGEGPLANTSDTTADDTGDLDPLLQFERSQ